MRIILNTKETELIPVQRTITLYFGMGGTNKLLMSLAAVNEGLIDMKICEPVIYMVDGKELNLPVLKSYYIDTYHWLPITFSVNKEVAYE